MKWKTKIHRAGDIKIKTKFLWTPISIECEKHREWYWLEKVQITYKLRQIGFDLYWETFEIRGVK